MCKVIGEILPVAEYDRFMSNDLKCCVICNAIIYDNLVYDGFTICEIASPPFYFSAFYNMLLKHKLLCACY